MRVETNWSPSIAGPGSSFSNARWVMGLPERLVKEGGWWNVEPDIIVACCLKDGGVGNGQPAVPCHILENRQGRDLGEHAADVFDSCGCQSAVHQPDIMMDACCVERTGVGVQCQ